MLLESYEARSHEQEVKEAYATHIVDLKEQIAYWRSSLDKARRPGGENS